MHSNKRTIGSRNGIDSATLAESDHAAAQLGDLKTHKAPDLAEVLAARAAMRRSSKLQSVGSEGVKKVAVSGQEIGGSSAALLSSSQ